MCSRSCLLSAPSDDYCDLAKCSYALWGQWSAGVQQNRLELICLHIHPLKGKQYNGTILRYSRRYGKDLQYLAADSLKEADDTALSSPANPNYVARQRLAPRYELNSICHPIPPPH